MQRDYEEMHNKPREERKKQVQKLQIKRLENKVAKDVEREIQYQKSRLAIEKIHKSLMKKRTNLDLSLDLNTPVSLASILSQHTNNQDSSSGKYQT